MKLIRMSDIQPVKVRWLWYPYIPYGKITMVQGDPGDGKTTFALGISALLTKGNPFPDTSEATTPVSVIFQTAEDGLSDTVRPRLDEVGADCYQVIVIDESDKTLTLSDERIEKAIIETQAKLLILDPLQAYLGDNVDMHRANEVRPVFRALTKVAERTGCAILIVGHMNKAIGQTKGLYRGLGSIDIAASARSILLIGRDKENENIRVMAHLKSSLAPEGSPMAFQLDKENGFRWVGTYDISVDDLLGGTRSEREPTKEIQAVRLITEMLRVSDLPCNEIYNRLVAYNISRRTAEKAKQVAGIRSYKNGANWYWSLSPK